MKRLVPVAIGLVLVVAGLFGLQAYFSGKDTGGVSSAAPQGPGKVEADRGAAHEQGAGVGQQANPPPTSGAHEPRNVTSEAKVDDATLLTTLELGDIVIAYPQARRPAALERLREDLAGPFDVELAALGQMVILVHRPGLVGIQALAWRRRMNALGPDDPQLRAFVDAWLGKGLGKTA